MPVTKILFIIDDMIIGGAQRSLLSLLHCLDYTQTKVDLLVLNKTGGFLDAVPKDVRILDTVSYYGRFFMEPGTASCQLIRAGRPDLALKRIALLLMSRWKRDMSGYYQVSGLVRPIGMDKSYSAVISCHYLASLYFALHSVSAVKKFHWYHHGDTDKSDGVMRFYQQCIRGIDGLFAVTEEHGITLTKAFPDCAHKIKVLPNAVSVDVIRTSSQETCLMDNLSDVFKIVTLGRLSPEKGNDLAIGACRYLVDADFAVKWFILGEGPERSRLEQMIETLGIKNHVSLIGEINNPYPYLRAADLVVQPSLVESFGYAIAEAKVLGKSVVATDTPGARAQLVDGETGVITTHNAQALAAAVAKLISEPELRENIGHRAAATLAGTGNISAKFLELIK